MHKHNKSKVNKFHDKVVNSWLKKDWKIIAGITYLTINIFDFILFPIMFAVLLPALHPGIQPMEWKPLTTSNGGLFHMAFGAILGVTAWREQAFSQSYAGAAQVGENEQSQYTQPQYSNQAQNQTDNQTSQSDPKSTAYDPNVFAGPDNYTDWDGNSIKR